MHYADTSALVKLVVPEPESSALRQWLHGSHIELVTSSIVRTELLRATRRGDVDAGAMARARDVLARLVIVDVTTEVLDTAGVLDPVEVRSLDAVHLATALILGDEIETVITYDARMAQAAAALGLAISAPA
ncbi:MAG: type II toxin-antitoxin system VapC family toxin [Microbacterium sp.]|uniref:type II toxin-antitoxin system VapC family toxin n=1 Tax=Microbacterium sp. TaxID=51671 RepID=UPI003A8B8D98